jgi:plasmid stabilization system protein ParE
MRSADPERLLAAADALPEPRASVIRTLATLHTAVPEGVAAVQTARHRIDAAALMAGDNPQARALVETRMGEVLALSARRRIWRRLAETDWNVPVDQSLTHLSDEGLFQRVAGHAALAVSTGLKDLADLCTVEP